MKGRWLCASVAALTLLTIGWAQTVRLQYKHKKGDVTRYEMKSKGVMKFETSFGGKSESGEGTMDDVSQFEHKVLDVDSAGNFTIETTSTSKGTMKDPDGKEESYSRKQVHQVKMAPTGKILSIKTLKTEEDGKEASEGQKGMGEMEGMEKAFSYLTAAVFPERDVKQGDTWTFTHTFSVPDAGTAKVTGQAKLVTFEKKGDYQCAVVDVTSSIPNIAQLMMGKEGKAPEGAKVSGVAKSKYRVWFAIEEGRDVYGEGRIDFGMSSSFSDPMLGTFGFRFMLATNFAYGLAKEQGSQ